MALSQRAAMQAHVRPHEIKFQSLDFKAVGEGGLFDGYAALFNREDLGHDVIAPGAFTDSLAGRGASAVKLLFQHDPNQPIGVWTELREDSKGLYVQGRLMPDVARAREVLSLMRAGALDGLSIGFKTLKGRRDPRSGLRRLEKIDLWEISIVTFPMQPEARITTTKARPFSERLPTIREFERWLTRDAGLTRSEARAILRDGLKGLEALRDADRGSAVTARLVERIRDAASVLKTKPRRSLPRARSL
jgi:uncharacterized protein